MVSEQKKWNHARLVGWLDRQPIWTIVAAIFVVCCGVFSLTAEWSDDKANVDAVATALPAWSFGTGGTIDLPSAATANPWVTEWEAGTYSNRPLGTWLVSVPAYWVLGDPQSFSTAPATLTAIVVTSAAIAVLFLVLTRVSTPMTALFGTLMMALGTATWSISSAQLWPHGTGQLAAAVGLLGLATGRYWISGIGFGYGVLTRPLTAIFPFVTGVGIAAPNKHQRLGPIMGVGLPSLLFLLLLVIYNTLVFGEPSVGGGYSAKFVDQLTTLSVGDYLANLGSMFILPHNGIAFWSPVIVVSAVAAVGVWRDAPRWVRWSAVAAVVYLFVHAGLNRASGGLAFNYRYPLEAIVMSAPLLLLGGTRWVHRGGARRTLVLGTAGLSIAMQATYVFTFRCQPFGANHVMCVLGF